MTVLVSGFRAKKKPTTITSVVGWDSARVLLNSEIVSERGRTHPTHTQSTGGTYKPRPANQGVITAVHKTTAPPRKFLLKPLGSLPDAPEAVNAILAQNRRPILATGSKPGAPQMGEPTGHSRTTNGTPDPVTTIPRLLLT